MHIDSENLARWRLILGKSAEESLQQMGNCVGQPILGGDQNELDEALEAIYSGDEIDKDEWNSVTRPKALQAQLKGARFQRSPNCWARFAISFPRTLLFCSRKMRSSVAA